MVVHTLTNRIARKTRQHKIGGCLRKKPYKTLWNAIIKVQNYRSKGIMVDIIYKCPFCDSLHIAHDKDKDFKDHNKRIYDIYFINSRQGK